MELCTADSHFLTEFLYGEILFTQMSVDTVHQALHELIFIVHRLHIFLLVFLKELVLVGVLQLLTEHDEVDDGLAQNLDIEGLRYVCISADT